MTFLYTYSRTFAGADRPVPLEFEMFKQLQEHMAEMRETMLGGKRFIDTFEEPPESPRP